MPVKACFTTILFIKDTVYQACQANYIAIHFRNYSMVIGEFADDFHANPHLFNQGWVTQLVKQLCNLSQVT